MESQRNAGRNLALFFNPICKAWILMSLCVSQAPAQSPDLGEASAKSNPALLWNDAVRPTYSFSADDERLLEDIQEGCFNFFWREVGDQAKLVKDRRHAEICSVAGVGFQLSSLPIGVERGWISRQDGEQRAFDILSHLVKRSDNKKFGIYLHFIDHHLGGLVPSAPQVQASTVDHALLVAGAMPAATYFGGRVAKLVDEILADADWRRFQDEETEMITFGWRPKDPAKLDGEGSFRPWTWKWASDEERLVYFLATGSPTSKHRVPASFYYKLDRRVMQHRDMPPFVGSWNGALFTYFFSHCWINYGELKADNPIDFGSKQPPVDWFENSRRAVLTHRQRCVEVASKFPTLSKKSWGLSPCNGFRENGETTYFVPSVRPNIADEENWCFGTVAPYGAGTSIMFTPRPSMEALREFVRLAKSKSFIGWESVQDGGYGLPDSFNLSQKKATHDTLAIDAGPMLLGIENARSGLIWKLFSEHPIAIDASKRLGFAQRQE